MSRGTFTPDQRRQLLQPIQGFRVQELDGISHLAAWDVTAHLNRMFGFEGWDKEVLSLEPVYEHVGHREIGHARNCNRREGCGCRNARTVPACSVGYRCLMRLTIYDTEGNVVRRIEDAAMGTATNQRDLGDAHDLAVKSAVSYALKRCAKDLGDQFGLSLYNKGQESACVQVVFPYQAEQPTEFKVNVEADGIHEGDDGFGDKRGDRSEPAAPAQPETEPREVAMPVEDGDPGAPVEVHPEPVREPEPAKPKADKPEPTPPEPKPEAPQVDERKIEDWYAEITTSTVVDGDTPEGQPRSVKVLWREIDAAHALDAQVLDLQSEKRMALREVMVRRVNEIQTGAAA